ncbi:MAG: hypothetical protein IPO07_28965 [Haliscomenobacter sp.]|nr:hypothetical protein [Haliscomenobacter sp.]MBK9492370.1 hypothetical protein [Haliscomenobacter sp.]
MSLKRSFFTLAVFLLGTSELLYGQKNDSAKTIFDFMAIGESLEMELNTDLTLLKDQKKSNEYQPATISFTDGAGQVQKWDIKLRSRGKFRRRICILPPLKLNFNKGDLQKAGLAKDDELKLITHCVEGYEGKEFLMREYLAYKLLALVSPYSLKVHLVEIKYRDTKNKARSTGWGILMEDEASMAKRYGAKLCDDCFSTPKDSLNMEQVNIACLFEYMIGNTDWSIQMVRNMKMLKFKDGSKAVMVPYDFDFSGFVNASYALPNADYKLTSIRERIFLSMTENDAEIASTKALFESKRQEMVELIKGFKALSAAGRNDAVSYINSFFESLKQPLRRP